MSTVDRLAIPVDVRTAISGRRNGHSCATVGMRGLTKKARFQLQELEYALIRILCIGNATTVVTPSIQAPYRTYKTCISILNRPDIGEAGASATSLILLLSSVTLRNLNSFRKPGTLGSTATSPIVFMKRGSSARELR